MMTHSETTNRSDKKSFTFSVSRNQLQIGGALLSLAAVLGAGIGVGEALSGHPAKSGQQPTAGQPKVTPPTSPASTTPSATKETPVPMRYPDICTVIPTLAVSYVMNEPARNQMRKACTAPVGQELITEIDYWDESGRELSVGIIDNAAAASSTQSLGSFEQWAANRATEHFIITTDNGRQYQAAADLDSLRARVGDYELDIEVGADPSKAQPGVEAGAAPVIADAQFQLFAKTVIEDVFATVPQP